MPPKISSFLPLLLTALALGQAGPAGAAEGGPTLPEADALRAAAQAKYPALVAREWASYGQHLYQKAMGNPAPLRAFWAELKSQEGVDPHDFLNQLNCRSLVAVAEGHRAPQSAFMLYAKVLRPHGTRHLVRAYGSEGYFGRALLGSPIRPQPLVDGVLPAHLVSGLELLVEGLPASQVRPGTSLTAAAVPLGRQRVAGVAGPARDWVVVRYLPPVGR